MEYQTLIGDCIESMRTLPDCSVDAVVTDPPYGIRFMGKAWDGADIEARHGDRRAAASHAPSAGPNGGHKSIAAEAGKYDLAPEAMRAFQEFSRAWAAEAMRVLKPGGHLLSFASPRTYHRMTSGIEDAGFEIRDQIMWIFGSGFPKSSNQSGDWAGWGTALKPAHEPICVARKPLVGTVAANVLQYGTGALNIDGCRVPTEESTARMQRSTTKAWEGGAFSGEVATGGALGRWPANLIHDGSDEVLAAFPDAKGQQGDLNETGRPRPSSGRFGDMAPPRAHAARVETEKSASRFFYCAKASKSERGEGNTHPTVKPIALMRYLCRLVTPPGSLVLDPFMGSGSTGKACMREGFRFIGCELDPAYMEIARARIEHERRKPAQMGLAL